MTELIEHLKVENFVLADKIEINPKDNLNVFTGETGAGKSLIVDAISFVCGERIGGFVNSNKEEKTRVEILFDISEIPFVRQITQDLDIDTEDDQLLILRELQPNGKSFYRINGRLSQAGIVRDITSKILDIHGQHEHQSLINNSYHLEIIDQLSSKTMEMLKNISEKYNEVKESKEKLIQLEKNGTELAHLLDLYTFQAKEISEANLETGEEEELGIDYERLINTEKIRDLCTDSYDSLTRDSGALELLGLCEFELSKAVSYDPNLEQILSNLTDGTALINEASRDLDNYISYINDDPETLDKISDRLDLIKKLKNKYGQSIDEIYNYYNDIVKKIENFTSEDFDIDSLKSKLLKSEDELKGFCKILSAERKSCAKLFEARVTTILRELAMDNVDFKVNFTEKQISTKGFDQVEFLISPNKGIPLMPLAKTASGGELSRISLAIKTAMAFKSLPVLIFDEIDSGISGLTGEVLGKKLAKLAENCQILCVTHLTQIASKGTTHFQVEKIEENEKTYLKVKELSKEERIHEISRMLGNISSEIARSHAKEILKIGN